jgi:hypothetical protein
MKKKILYIGLDVHKKSIDVAITDEMFEMARTPFRLRWPSADLQGNDSCRRRQQ